MKGRFHIELGRISSHAAGLGNVLLGSTDLSEHVLSYGQRAGVALSSLSNLSSED